mgnify:CR=1 FL=1
MSIELRPCQASDVEQAIPLMFSAGPEAFRYVFSVNYKDQALDFLRYAFCQGDGEFGYKDHQLALDKGKVVALVGRRLGKDNSAYMLAAIKQIFGFYGFITGLRVIIRGLRFEQIVTPPKAGVACLHNLGVSEGQRGKGYGRQVIEKFIEQAKSKGVSLVSLDVAETNPRAKALYERLGFEVKSKKAGRLKNRYGRGVGHEYMEISLS